MRPCACCGVPHDFPNSNLCDTCGGTGLELWVRLLRRAADAAEQGNYRKARDLLRQEDHFFGLVKCSMPWDVEA